MLGLVGSALAIPLAGCSGDGSPGNGDTPTGTEPTDTGTPTSSPTPSTPDSLANASFESGWSGWTVGQHLPTDPNYESTRPVAWSAGVTTEDATDGLASCRLFIDGSQDDGTVWVQQPVDLSAYDFLAVDYRVSDSFNEIRKAAAYAGPVPEEDLTEQDFDTSQSLEGHDRPGWKTFTYEVSHDGPGLVAVGFSIVWETGAHALLDDVRLSSEQPTTITPAETATDEGGAGTL